MTLQFISVIRLNGCKVKDQKRGNRHQWYWLILATWLGYVGILKVLYRCANNCISNSLNQIVMQFIFMTKWKFSLFILSSIFLHFISVCSLVCYCSACVHIWIGLLVYTGSGQYQLLQLHFLVEWIKIF